MSDEHVEWTDSGKARLNAEGRRRAMEAAVQQAGKVRAHEPDTVAEEVLEELRRERDELRRKVDRYRYYWHKTVEDYGTLYQHVVAGDLFGAQEEAARHTIHLPSAHPTDSKNESPEPPSDTP